jgi:eukaryotic-like serine/threonine-protein kinase
MAKRKMSMPVMGDMIAGRYEILALIGEGGGGSVYKARQLNVEREVALKLLPAESMDDITAMRRFEREARLISRLRHPNTITVYEFDRTADGVLYIAMELIKGQSLKDGLKQDLSFAPQRAVRILQQSLKSLAEAHSVGIIHRDIKPANIMLCDMHGDPDFVKVLDFGVATVLSDGQSMTQPPDAVPQRGVVGGTPQYMSPEQFRSRDIGAPSDLYSLGVVTFEMLTGFSPFNGETVNDILIKHLFDPIPPIPEFLDDYPVLVQVVRKLLSKEPADRYQSAEEVLEALKQWKGTQGRPGLTSRRLEARPSLMGLSIDSTVPTDTAPSIPTMQTFSPPTPRQGPGPSDSDQVPAQREPQDEALAEASSPQQALTPTQATTPRAPLWVWAALGALLVLVITLMLTR